MKFKGKLPKLSLRLPRLNLSRFSIKGIQFSQALLWRCVLIFLWLVCVGLLVAIWYSGSTDTQSAMTNGRRLLVDLQTGIIEGKQVSLDKDKKEDASDKSGKGKSADAKNGDAKSDTSTEETAAVAPLDAAEPMLPEDVPEASAVKPAEIPLAEVKPGLSEKTTSGLIPVISTDGEKPWRFYAKPYQRKDKKPVIAMIVTGLGQSKSVTSAAIKLPENVTLSFNPYARETVVWAPAARTAGHEVMIDLPLEPSNYPASDPGPYGLLVAKGGHENASRLQWLMSRFQGYIGFAAPQNEVFTVDTDSFTMLLQSLEKRGLMLSIGHESAKTETKQLIDSTPTANVVVDVLIDEELSPPAIQARLNALERKALKNGSAVGMAQSYPLTIKQLETWMQQVDKDGIAVVPVSYVVSLKSK